MVVKAVQCLRFLLVSSFYDALARLHYHDVL